MVNAILIGDSHVGTLQGVEDIDIYEIFGATAHNLIKLNSTLQTGNKLFNRIDLVKDDKIILWFGEIDCRIHIYYQHKKTGKSIEELINDTVGRYLRAIDIVRSRGKSFVVMGISPANNQDNIYGYEHYADLKTKCGIYTMFNNKMKEECAKVGYKYIDIMKFFGDKDGAIRNEFTNDGVHLNNKTVPIIMKLLSEAGISRGDNY